MLQQPRHLQASIVPVRNIVGPITNIFKLMTRTASLLESVCLSAAEQAEAGPLLLHHRSRRLTYSVAEYWPSDRVVCP